MQKSNAAFRNGDEARVIADLKTVGLEIRSEGIDTGTKSTTISSEYDGGYWVQLFQQHMLQNCKPAIVMADGESANPGELALFTTNGTGWQHVGEWLKNNNTKTKNYAPQNTNDLFDPTKPNTTVKVDGINLYANNLNLLRRATAVGEEGKLLHGSIMVIQIQQLVV